MLATSTPDLTELGESIEAFEVSLVDFKPGKSEVLVRRLGDAKQQGIPGKGRQLMRIANHAQTFVGGKKASLAALQELPKDAPVKVWAIKVGDELVVLRVEVQATGGDTPCCDGEGNQEEEGESGEQPRNRRQVAVATALEGGGGSAAGAVGLQGGEADDASTTDVAAGFNPTDGSVGGGVSMQRPGVSDMRLEVVLRGPVHEGFARPIRDTLLLGDESPTAPPKPLDEVTSKVTEGWEFVPGYWCREPADGEFVWVPGILRRAPEGMQWRPGEWLSAAGKFRRLAGYWEQVGDVKRAPNASLNEVVVPARRVLTRSGILTLPSYVDHALEQRGKLFAPLCRVASLVDRTERPNTGQITRPLHRIPPRVAIAVENLVFHLFSSPDQGQFCFGDYYGQVRETLGMAAWHEAIDNKRSLVAQYSQNYARRGVNLVRRLKAWSNFFEQHPQLRPPTSLAAARQLVESGKQQAAVRAASLCEMAVNQLDSQPRQVAATLRQGQGALQRKTSALHESLSGNLGSLTGTLPDAGGLGGLGGITDKFGTGSLGNLAGTGLGAGIGVGGGISGGITNLGAGVAGGGAIGGGAIGGAVGGAVGGISGGIGGGLSSGVGAGGGLPANLPIGGGLPKINP